MTENNNIKIVNTPKLYEVDFEKVSSVHELRTLIEVLYKSLKIYVQEESIYYESLKDILKEVK